MSRWTERQLAGALVWLNEQWNKPNRSDHYAMQVACEVRRVLSKKPGDIQMKHFSLSFKEQALPSTASVGTAALDSEHRTETLAQQQLALAKGRWAVILDPVRRKAAAEQADTTAPLGSAADGN